ncbi:hypothetical protein QE152_g23296 [Popillia japonica]|uniref:Uncharacterized protein n=1 Tax=Popillia japonica TaxID=7064 RepID=A0AAW1KHQ4_POPJA
MSNSPKRFINNYNIQTDLQTKTEPKDTRPRLQDERRYSPRHQTKMSNSPKRFINNYNRNPKHAANRARDFEKYSNRDNITPQQNKVNPIKKLDEPVKKLQELQLLQKQVNGFQFSSKKKRKNRSTPDDDTEQLIEESDCLQKIEDLNISIEELQTIEIKEVITCMIEPILEEVQSSKIDNIIEVITNCEATPKKSNDIPNIDQIQLRDVKDVEEELFKASAKQAEIEASILKQEEAHKIVPEPKSESSQPQPTPKSTNQHENQKKKAKKTGGKNSIKRIIIFDPHVSKEETPNTNAKSQLKPEPQINENPEKISQKNFERGCTLKLLRVYKKSKRLIRLLLQKKRLLKRSHQLLSRKEATKKKKNTEKIAPTPLEESIDISATPDKKKSKKKKKVPKSNLSTSIPSISSSTATLNNIDDSYDFLLDTTRI